MKIAENFTGMLVYIDRFPCHVPGVVIQSDYKKDANSILC